MLGSSTDILKYDIDDETSAVTPAYVAGMIGALIEQKKYEDSLVIGVCDTGARTERGMGLKWIDIN